MTICREKEELVAYGEIKYGKCFKYNHCVYLKCYGILPYKQKYDVSLSSGIVTLALNNDTLVKPLPNAILYAYDKKGGINMDKKKFIPAIAPTNNGPIDFYIRLDQIIAIAYPDDPKYKDNYFVILTNEEGTDYFVPFYYAHKDIVHKYFDLEQMPVEE